MAIIRFQNPKKSKESKPRKPLISIKTKDLGEKGFAGCFRLNTTFRKKELNGNKFAYPTFLEAEPEKGEKNHYVALIFSVEQKRMVYDQERKFNKVNGSGFIYNSDFFKEFNLKDIKNGQFDFEKQDRDGFIYYVIQNPIPITGSSERRLDLTNPIIE